MKKIFTLITAATIFSISAVKGQNLFNQDFTTDGVVTDYYNATAAPANKFDYISSFGNAPASVSNGFFSWNKIAGSSAYMIRNTNISENASFIKFQMRVRFTPPTTLAGTSSGGAYICIGNGTSDAWALKNGSATATPSATESFARYDFYFTTGLDKVTFRAGGSTTEFEGWQDITMFCNKTGSTVSYVGPNNETNSVNSGSSDLWIGNIKVRANAVAAGTIDLKKFKLTIPSQLQNMKTEIDYIKIWDQTVLPVTLTDFSGKAVESGVKLNWETASEKNNSHFEILRANNALDFQTIATISGKGDANTLSSYQYIDYSPLVGTNYYKLKQVDFDGQSEEFEKVVAVNFGLTKSNLQAYYTNGDLKVVYQKQGNSVKANIKLADISGRIILNDLVKLNEGTNNLSFNKNLSPGVYLLNVEENGKLNSIKIII